jgi:signal transduction histidine kinase
LPYPGIRGLAAVAGRQPAAPLAHSGGVSRRNEPRQAPRHRRSERRERRPEHVAEGPGIDADLLPRLFDRENGRAQGAGKRQGLGLFIVRRVMELHGGSVTVERNSENGTTMRLVSPQGTEE